MSPGDIVDRYELLRALGRGGMAEVWLVRDPLLGRELALKLLNPDLAANGGLLARFLQEGRIQSGLRHAHIAAVSNVVVSPPALVMDYVAGPSLERWLRENPGPQPLARLREILLPVIDAVGHAHQHEVVHRDLKPSNILLATRTDGGLHPWVIDFGVARDQAQRHTATGTAIGTPHYMAPEQIVGRALDGRADIFALGALLYELCTGELAFPGPTEFEAWDAIMERRFKAPGPILAAIHPPQIADALTAIIDKALAKEPRDRFQDCASLADALRTLHHVPPVQAQIQPTSPTLAPTTPTPPPTPPRPARRPSALGRWMLPLLLLTGLPTAFGVFWVRQRKQDADRAAAAAMELLRHYKTDKVANADDDALKVALDEATTATTLWMTPDALGAMALASVWSHRWHMADASFDAENFDADNTLTLLAADGSVQGALARAIFAGYACNMKEAPAEPRAVLCAETDRRYATAEERLDGDGPPWLRLEAAWTHAVISNRRAWSRWESGDRAGARSAWNETSRICTKGKENLPYGPVNDRELGEECLVATGALGLADEWLAWARWLRTRRSADGQIAPAAVTEIYRSARPGCRNLDTERSRVRGQRGLVVSSPQSEEQRYCAAAGLMALGCPDQARAQIPATLIDPELPWLAINVWTGGDEPCYLLR